MCAGGLPVGGVVCAAPCACQGAGAALVDFTSRSDAISVRPWSLVICVYSLLVRRICLAAVYLLCV